MSHNKERKLAEMPQEAPTLDAEAHYLSCCLCDNALIDEQLAKGYDHAIFAPGRYRDVGKAMVSIRERGDAVNHVTLPDEMRAAGSFRAFGEDAAIIDLMMLVDTSCHAKTYLRIVLDGYSMRRFREYVAELNQATQNERYDDVLAVVERSVTKISELCLVENSEKPMDIFVEAEAILESMMNGEEPRRSRPIYSGIKCIDEVFGPLNVATSDFNALLMGPTSYGKSSLASQYIADAVARGYRVVVFMGETSSIDLPLQVASQRAQVMTGQRYYPSEPKDKQRKAISELKRFGEQAEGRLFVYDSNFSIESVVSRCRSVAAKEGPIDLIVIDHLHLLKTSHRVGGTRERMEHISSCLKPLAKELDCVCLSLVQPSRDMQKEERPPRLSDLKDSGSLENDADRVLALYPPKYDSGGSEQDRGTLNPEVRLFQLKMRKGPTGVVSLRFQKPYTLFKGLEGEY